MPMGRGSMECSLTALGLGQPTYLSKIKPAVPEQLTVEKAEPM